MWHHRKTLTYLFAYIVRATSGLMLLVNDDDELQSLERRRLTADLIFTYRIIFGLVDVCMSDYFQLMPIATVTLMC